LPEDWFLVKIILQRLPEGRFPGKNLFYQRLPEDRFPVKIYFIGDKPKGQLSLSVSRVYKPDEIT
jgi:hypothetical protein